jgi:hypothetical protein
LTWTDLSTVAAADPDRRRPEETEAEWRVRTAPRGADETDAAWYRRKLGGQPRHPHYRGARTLCLSLERGCPACLAVLEWRRLDGIVRQMERREALARQGSKPRYCAHCGFACDRCAALVDRKCCPDCACGAASNLPSRQVGLPFEQRTLDLEPMLNPDSVSSIRCVTKGRL